MSVELLGKIEEYNLERFGKELVRICKPLFDTSRIAFFEYNKSFSDNSRITLTTNAEWVYNYYNSGYYKNGMHHKDVHTYNSGYNFWNSVGRSCVLELAKERFRIDNGFTIIERSLNACEFYHFGSLPGENHMVNFYYNHINMLRHFIAYFKSETRMIIKSSLRNKIRYISDNKPYDGKSLLIDPIKDFYTKTPISKFYFNVDENQDYLTKQELIISQWIVQGKTAEEIGEIVDTTSRTIETHICSIKKKLNCYKQTQLVYKLLNIGIDKLTNLN